MRLKDQNKIALVKLKATELLVEGGFEGFSMQKLAKLCSISPATLYIYYKDKNDLLIMLGSEYGSLLANATLKDFDPGMNFRTGLKKQWENRAKFVVENPQIASFFDILKHSPLCHQIGEAIATEIRPKMIEFTRNAINNKELIPLPLEVYWCLAFGPLYTLLKFHKEGYSMSGVVFELKEDYLEKTLDLVVKALTP